MIYTRAPVLSGTLEMSPTARESILKRDFMPLKRILTFENVLKSCYYVTGRLCMHWDPETIIFKA